VNPHFLFNSLTALSTLTTKEPQQAQKMCVQLSEFLRYNLRYEQKHTTTIREELENIENYLAIEQIRLGERLSVDMDVDPSVHSVKTLPFILLPLIENAVKHGIQECINGGTLHFQIQTHDDFMWIRVRNPVEQNISVSGMGMGLNTLKKRLAVEYENQFQLKIDHTEDMYFVDLKIPRKWRKR
jgi:LytS/YehU family sensor histidine kinase